LFFVESIETFCPLTLKMGRNRQSTIIILFIYYYQLGMKINLSTCFIASLELLQHSALRPDVKSNPYLTKAQPAYLTV